MSRTWLAVLATTAAALAGAFLPTSASAAEQTQTGDSVRPAVRLVLSVTYSEADPAHTGTRYGYLTCAPDGGIHNNAAAACAELYAAGGDVSATDHESGVACTMMYAPVTVRALGWYGERRVDYRTTYGNSCVFAATAGQLWNF
ncbi:SSI family serine proteinase inhibitor [Saccharothrix variisporea]|uniref:Subtilisin inhibitor-like n=1 Tax=Saccharothrix variisporea TaxID=543527 RepID=A0A495X0F0_9PSEU|nr:SSI family serine proteinase inhibitor [Saccharothrix variisporea]RKT67601.1 subtilisin inhibitor-like [Saccharothrix variisporea]